MKVIFLGRKPYSCKALDYLISQKAKVVAIVAIPEKIKTFWNERLVDKAKEYNIPVISDQYLYKLINKEITDKSIDLENIDLVISYLYWKKIKPELINLPLKGCINFHPAPLPELKGLGGYNFALYDEMNYYGVSAHFIDETFDTGDIIKVNKFDINPHNETAYSLEQKSQKEMYTLFKEVVNMIISAQKLPRIKQTGGRYITRSDFNNLRKINNTDSIDIINKKVKAFWYPPQHGAYIEIDGEEYTLISKELLNEIGKDYH